MKKISLLFYLTFVQFSLQAQNVFTIQGKISDVKTQEGIPFATMSLKDLAIGTAANELGEFIFKIPYQYKDKSIIISSIGYQTKTISLAQIQELKGRILLVESLTNLEEISVQAKSVESIVREAIRKIPENHDFGSTIYTQFFLSQDYIKSKPTWILEIVLKSYINNSKVNAKILKKRAKVLNETYKESYEEGKGFLPQGHLISLSAMEENYINNYIPVFMKERRMKNFIYTLKDIIVDAQDTTFVIEAIEKRLANEERRHIMHIDKQSLGFKYYRYYYNLRVGNYRNRESFYRKIGNKWYLEKATFESPLMQNEKSKKIQKDVLIVTDIDINTSESFSNDLGGWKFLDNIEPTLDDFNDKTWEEYNFIRSQELKDAENFVKNEKKIQILEDTLTFEASKIIEEEGKFRIVFPESPDKDEDYMETEAGDVLLTTYTYANEGEDISLPKFLLTNKSDLQMMYFFVHYDFPENMKDKISSSQVLEVLGKKFMEDFGLEIKSIEDANRNLYSGKKIKASAEDDEIYAYLETYKVKNRIYQLFLLKPTDDFETKSVRKFLKSWILK